jgi:hypothetical protein
MATGTVTSSAAAGGVTFSSVLTVTASGVISFEETLPAGKSGTLSTRTDNDTGVVTVSAGHSVTTSDIVDVYWSTYPDTMRYGMSVTETADTSISINAGSGANLPASATSVIVTPRVNCAIGVDGDDVDLALFHCDQRASIDMTDSGGTSIAQVELTGNRHWAWAEGDYTNPLSSTSDIAFASCSNGSTTSATIKGVLLYDVTP